MKLLFKSIPVLTLTSLVVPAFAHVDAPPPPAIVAPAPPKGGKVALARPGAQAVKGRAAEARGRDKAVVAGSNEQSASVPFWAKWVNSETPSLHFFAPEGMAGGQCDQISYGSIDAPYTALSELLDIVLPGGHVKSEGQATSKEMNLLKSPDKSVYLVKVETGKAQLKVMLVPNKAIPGQYRIVYASQANGKESIGVRMFYANPTQVKPFNDALVKLSKQGNGEQAQCYISRKLFAAPK